MTTAIITLHTADDGTHTATFKVLDEVETTQARATLRLEPKGWRWTEGSEDVVAQWGEENEALQAALWIFAEIAEEGA